jgi:hypothetical protein
MGKYRIVKVDKYRGENIIVTFYYVERAILYWNTHALWIRRGVHYTMDCAQNYIRDKKLKCSSKTTIIECV